MRRGRKKGANRDKVFGCDLQEHLNSTAQDIPPVLRNCSEFIEEYGIVDGIYRLSGVSSNTQKLRNEFDTEGTPDLYKDVYLQDIHCVSSLCKAYFRELPNPLLTYELYDRFADAVAIQLEDERLVKINEVLKDLPVPHYRTLEFLMHHLVKMSTYASQTNMHSRNLAIVWAPNLLRSKDIESTGFNGTAAFMEVRVQSIVVEFILTHVPELFTSSGSATERRKSLPSPTLLAHQDEHFFKSLPLHCSGNLSPGDGPPLMRSYHAIIDGTDKRKGSLKGRKWKSIFNLGGRIHDPRKKNKYCPKDKEKTSLRPAKSMDSLSSAPYPLEDSKHPAALLMSPANPEGGASVGGGVSSGYAVTYRRTGGAQVSMVSSGTQGTYNRLDSVGGAEGSSQGTSRSPGMTSKADRRAGIHISGPFSVTVPLHITSGLALGVLQGGWNEKEQTVQGDAADEEQAEREDEGEDVKGSEPVQTYTDESKTDDDDDEDDVKENKGDVDAPLDLEKMTTQIIVEEDEETFKSDMTQHEETEERNVEDVSPQNEEAMAEEEYMDMRGHLHQAQVISEDHSEMDEFSEQDVQDAFGFLDMMDSCASNQAEFSVEAPEEGVEEDEDEDESKNIKTPVSLVQNRSDECEIPAVHTTTHRVITGKSHSLPYKSRPFMPALSLSSDDDRSPEDEDDSDKDSEYEDMFCQSLPSAREFQRLSRSLAKNADHWAEDVLSNSQSKRLDDVILPPDSKELQSLSQSEDTILTARTDEGETMAGTSVQIYNEEHVSGDSKREDLHIDDEKNEVKSDDVTNDTNPMTVEGDLENSEGEEDTYFGPDPIPCSPETNWTETDSISVHEPIQEQWARVDALPDTEIYSAIEIIITDVSDSDVTESTEAQDEVNANPSPDAENTTMSDGEEMTTQPDETEQSEESLEDEATVLEFKTHEREKTWSVNEEDPEEEVEMEDRVKDETSEDEEEREEVKEHEPCEFTENTEQERVEMEDRVKDETTEDEEEREEVKEHEPCECAENTEQERDEMEDRLKDETTEDEEEREEVKEHEPCECAENTEQERDEMEDRVKDETTEDEEEREEVKEQEPCEFTENTEQERVEMENSFDIDKEYNERNVESTEMDSRVNTDSDEERSEHIVEGKLSSEENSREDDSCEQTEEPVNEKSSVTTDEQPPQTAEDRPVPEEEIETSAPKHVKAVPAVPPKPQRSKLTALTLRKQFEDRDAERKRHSQVMDTDEKRDETEERHTDDEDKNCREPTSETNGGGMAEDDEIKASGDAGIDFRKDLQRDGEREAKRNSGISMCFDEAVARATEKRSRETSERLSGAQWERESRREGFKHREKDDENKTD